MCSDSGQVASQDLALQNADVAETKAFDADYTTTFAEQQGILAPLQAKLTYMAANPMGYSGAALAAQRASINNNTATAAKQAIGAAAAYSAAHGGADVGGGGISSTVGQIANEAAQSKAGQLENLTESNEQLKQANMWKSLAGLQDVGAAYGGAGSVAGGDSSSASNAGEGAGAGAVSAANTGWSDFGAVLEGAAGLATAGVTAYKNCWIAAAIYGGWTEPRTELVRAYLQGEFSETWYGRGLVWLYSRTGKRLAEYPFVVRMLKPLFDLALRKAQEK